MTTKEEFLTSRGRTTFGAVHTRTASGLCLHRDNKTGFLSKRKGSSREWEAMVPNALPLPAGPEGLGGTCPGATAECVSCYAIHGLENRLAFAAIVEENLRVIVDAHEQGRLVEVLLEAVDLSVAAAERFGVPASFRWQSDGDLFAPWYARAIRQVALSRPAMPMWLYTRSFRPGANFVGALVGRRRPPNLHVFMSVDAFNVTDAARQLHRFAKHGVRVAVLSGSPEERAELEAKLGVATVVCPATGRYRRDGHGSSFVAGLDGRRAGLPTAEMAQGACGACRFCLRDDTRSVAFYRHGGQHSTESAVRLLVKRPLAAGSPRHIT